MTFAQPFSEYEILARVGSGSMGTVFKAHHKKLNRIVALKVLRPSLARDARYVDRLRREARIVASLNHPNIVTGYDLGQEGGYHFFVMEFIEGQSLRQLLHEWGMFPEEQVLDVAIQAATALDHAYKKGVIHRDIKPANILIDNQSQVKLTDMGLAKGPDNLTITREGATVGTPQYISPEQARDPQSVDVRSDLYSLGATLYHMCTGQPPFLADTMASVLVKVLNERAPSAAGLNPDLSDGLSLVLRKLLSKDRERRYETPGDLLTDLRLVERAEQPNVDEEDLDQPEGEKTERSWVWILSAVALLVLLVSLGSVFWGGDDQAGVVEGPSKEEKFRHEVVEALKCPTWGKTLGELRRQESRASAEWQRTILGEIRQQSESTLRGQLLGFLERQKQVLRSFFKELEDWRDSDTFFDDKLPEALYEKFGLGRTELPTSLAGACSKAEVELEQLMRKLVSDRNKVHAQLYETYLKNSRSRWREPLRVGDFRTAESKLREALAGFHGLEGQPALDILPNDHREELIQKREAAEKVAIAAIDELEKQKASGMLAEVAARLENIEKLVEKLPENAQGQLADFRRHLDGQYPEEFFRVKENPWSLVRKDLNKLAGMIGDQLVLDEGERLATNKRMVYQFALQGRIQAALLPLRGSVFRHHQAEVTRHQQLLEAAHAAREKLLSQILGAKTKRSVSVASSAVPGGKKLSLVLSFDQKLGRFAFRQKDQSLALPELDVAGLCELAGGEGFRQGLDPMQRFGLGLWYVLAGDHLAGVSFVEVPADSRFLADVVNPVVQKLRQAKLSLDGEAPLLLAEAFKAAIKQDWALVLEIVDRLRREHSGFADENKRELRRLEDSARGGLLTAKDLARLRKQAKEGVLVEMAGKGQAKVTYPMGEAQLDIPSGWSRARGEASLVYSEQGKGLAEAMDRPLVLPSLLDPEQNQLSVQLELSFAADHGRRRLVLFSCHGAHLALGVLRSGAVVAAVVKQRELSSAKELIHQVQEPLRQVASKPQAHVVPGARHVLRLEIRPLGSSKLKVQVSLDGKKLGTLKPTRPLRLKPELRVMPLEPLTLFQVRFEGLY